MSLAAECSIEIEAPIGIVWDVMLDLPRYGEWNPFIYSIDGGPGPVAVGTRLHLLVRWEGGGGASSTEIVTALDPPAGGTTALLEYRYADPLAAFGLVRAARTQKLTASASGVVRYETRDAFRGLLSRFVPLRKVQAGFEAHARALKTRAEALAREAHGATGP